ncbi:response regulator transcription factor [Pedobacter sp. SYSU D00535]|uniref:response regulator transcription factor n=1 Tax=Pedobacter sp. SYSU D00535 TaxID=2810308 RepID=UPI001A95902C|nr:response regulator transcription factor [Pedobacter sp. SYSU D00535]
MREKILIVGHDTQLSESLDELLTFEGYETYLCSKMADVPNFVHNFSPDLLILDQPTLQLGEKSEIIFYPANAAGADVPIILLSDEDVDLRHVGLSVRECVRKPLQVSKLLATLDRHLSMTGFLSAVTDKPHKVSVNY